MYLWAHIHINTHSHLYKDAQRLETKYSLIIFFKKAPCQYLCYVPILKNQTLHLHFFLHIEARIETSLIIFIMLKPQPFYLTLCSI